MRVGREVLLGRRAERDGDLARALGAVGADARQPQQRAQRQPAQLLRRQRRVGGADGDARAVRLAPVRRRPELEPGHVEVVAVAEVAEQQHADVVLADDAARRCRCRPGSRSRSSRCRRPRCPRRPRARGCQSAPSTSPIDDRARVGHVAVVALADHRQHDVVGPAAGGQHRGLEDRADGVRSRTGRRASAITPRSSISSFDGQLAHAVDHRGAGARRQRRRRDDGHAGALPAGRLGVADAHARHVRDRVARARRAAARPARPRSRQRIWGERRVVQQAGGQLPGAGRGAAAPDRRWSHGSKRRGQRGWKRHPDGTLVASGSSPDSGSRMRASGATAPARRRRAPGCRDAAGARSRRRPSPARRSGPGT